MTTTPLSGTQHHLRSGDYEAVVASVGASVRTLRHRGRDLVVPFDAEEVRPVYRGALLAPWPNRIVDGRYGFDGQEHQLALTEPDRGHALHGLVAWTEFTPVATPASDRLELVATIEPQTGYPWRLRVETSFALGADGLTQTVRARNETPDAAAPFGTAPHPYLVAGPHPLDTWTLQLPAAQVLEVTPDRLSPVALVGVESDAERFDFRAARPICAVRIDHAFTDLRRNDADEAEVVLRDEAAGTGVRLVFGEGCPWVQIHTADLPGGPAQPGHRAGLAAEPMTCAPDAFNAPRYDYDTGLLVLAPGAEASASWRIEGL